MRQVISLNQNCKTKVGYILACLKPIRIIKAIIRYSDGNEKQNNDTDNRYNALNVMSFK